MEKTERIAGRPDDPYRCHFRYLRVPTERDNRRLSLCLKSGNCVILKGSSEASHSNRALFGLIQEALKKTSISTEIVHLVDVKDRSYIYELLTLEEHIDLCNTQGRRRTSEKRC